MQFPVGAVAGSSSCFFLSLIDDDKFEGVESIVVTASSENPYVQFTQAGDNNVIINILDDDGKLQSSSLTLLSGRFSKVP